MKQKSNRKDKGKKEREGKSSGKEEKGKEGRSN